MTMSLDRWVALGILLLCAVYGYAAWFEMDELLAPIMRRNPIWPSTFPKVLAALGMIFAISVILNLEKEETKDPSAMEINYMRLTDYNLGQALGLLILMVVYAFALRPVGFLASTFIFLVAGSYILGERKWILMVSVSALAAGVVWYLVEQVLGIFLRPLPMFLTAGA